MRAYKYLFGLALILMAGLFSITIDVSRAYAFEQTVEDLGVSPIDHLQINPPWIDSASHNNIAYFLFESPARIERYDMVNEVWLSTISLTATPTAFTVDADGLYIAFGSSASHFSLNGTGETHLLNTVSDISSLMTSGPYLYVGYNDYLTSINKLDGTHFTTTDYWYRMVGHSIAPSTNKVFARSTGISPADIIEVVLNADGTLGLQDDSPYHGSYPTATQTFVLPGDNKVVDSSGIIYNASDLTYSGSFAGTIDDLTFDGTLPIVLRGDSLIAYSSEILETGSHTPAKQPVTIYVYNSSIFSFSTGGSLGVEETKIPVNLLTPDTPGAPVDPNGLSYTPDHVILGNNEILYILS
ncbi:MAG: hypothetical protein AAF485_05915, partial [Chloroflexota bacterium]